jgi:hypothetical protein
VSALVSALVSVSGRVARFFGDNLPKWEKYTNLPGNIPNVNIIWQMAIKYTKWT